MYYVYAEYVRTGKSDFCRTFHTQDDAIRHLAKCYRIDSELGQLGDYYYYIKKH